MRQITVTLEAPDIKALEKADDKSAITNVRCFLFVILPVHLNLFLDRVNSLI